MNYEKIYNDLIVRGKTRVSKFKGEIHHILPRSMGGSDNKENLVKLTFREHFLAHFLLYKIHRNREMAYAMNRMLNTEKYLRSSKLYEIARIYHQRAVSEWSKNFMKDKVLMRNIKSGKCALLIKGSFNPKEWCGVNKGVKLPGIKGMTCFKNEKGEVFRLHVNDPRIKTEKLVGIGNTVAATAKAAELEKAKPWYNKSATNPEAIKLIPNLYEWYVTKYDPDHYKRTGVAKWKSVNNITVNSKLFGRAFNEFKRGWIPDEKFYEVYNEICKN
ncbi:HNH endonuclease [Salmonella enterica]